MQLALAEKINAIQKYFVEKTRLGIPIIAFDEALHGLVRDEATAFPQAIALAATWDTADAVSVATAIANETKARGIRHIFRRWSILRLMFDGEEWKKLMAKILFLLQQWE